MFYNTFNFRHFIYNLITYIININNSYNFQFYYNYIIIVLYNNKYFLPYIKM